MRCRFLLLPLLTACYAYSPAAHAQYYPYYAPGYYPPGYYRPAPQYYAPPAYQTPYYNPPPVYAAPPNYSSANCGTPDHFKPCYR